jgi:hypothetical protein
MQAPASLGNWQSFFHTERATFGIGSTKSASVPLPIAVHDALDSFSSPKSRLPFGGHEEHTLALAWIPEQVDLHTPCPHRDVALALPLEKADPPRSRPTWVPAVSHHASVPRLRLSTAGFHSRLRGDFAWSHFFPRSVGFAPTASRAKGAFTIAPSILCQDQAIPSVSSYSASPLRQRRTKTPSRFHSKKYLWMELALPNSPLGKAFHWHPVRSTKIIPPNTFRASIRFRPPPGRRRYFRFFFRFHFGMRGLTRLHNSSDTVHDLMALMPCHYHERT